MFIHTNREEVTQLPKDHNGVPQLHVCPSRYIPSPNGVEEAKVETYYCDCAAKHKNSYM